jgi:Mycolic acid cyclopropane synthetase
MSPGTGRAASTPKGAAGVVAGLIGQAGLDLPVRLRAWDGSETGPADAPVLVARSPRALQRILWRPGELGLARAYVSGDLDVEGDLTDALRRVRAAARGTRAHVLPATLPATLAAVRAATRLKLLAPPPESPRCELRVRGRRHSRARDQAVIAGHYDLPAAFYRLILDPGMAYSCCAALYDKLRPGGRLLIQQMSRGGRAPGGGPFIESYIAPDMDMRPVGDTITLIQGAGFEVIGVEAMREHYVRTIRAWLDNFERNLPAITQILTAEQVRVWRLYLTGAVAFEQGRMGVDQILAVRPGR